MNGDGQKRGGGGGVRGAGRCAKNRGPPILWGHKRRGKGGKGGAINGGAGGHGRRGPADVGLRQRGPRLSAGGGERETDRWGRFVRGRRAGWAALGRFSAAELLGSARLVSSFFLFCLFFFFFLFNSITFDLSTQLTSFKFLNFCI